ncbi:hypothetical protein CCYA_CCYA09G2555 [Cyanidiococcus yangmingshanensis]|nr:hypothetical protein CCYA_CCYA09G2555 [Cyanidiococcus yangmingshanensis]
MEFPVRPGSIFGNEELENELSPFSAEDELAPDTSVDSARAQPERWRLLMEPSVASAPLVVEITRQLGKLRERVNGLEQQLHQKQNSRSEPLEELADRVATLEVRLGQLWTAGEHAPPALRTIDSKLSLGVKENVDDQDSLSDTVKEQLHNVRAFELRLSRAVDARFQALFEWTETRLTTLQQALDASNIDKDVQRHILSYTDPLQHAIQKLESVMRSCVSREEWSRDREALEKRLLAELETAISRLESKQGHADRGHVSASVAQDAMRSVIHLQSAVEGNARAVEDALSAIRATYQALNQRLQRMEAQSLKDENSGRADSRQTPSLTLNQLQQDIRRLEDQWRTMTSRLPDNEEIAQSLMRTSELVAQSNQLQCQVDGLQRQLDGERNHHSELGRRLARLEELASPLQSLTVELARLTHSINQGDEALQEWVRGQLERLDTRLCEHSSLLHELQAETEHLYQQYAEVAALILVMTPAENRTMVEQRIRQLMPGIASPTAARAAPSRGTR